MLRWVCGAIAVAALGAAPLQAAPLPVVAAESVYGELARQIGGSAVSVTSILTNPDQDPHAFEAGPPAARALADARLVVYNGLGYDAWVLRLLAASRGPGRHSLEVAQLLNKKPGDNPHLWYDPAAAPALGRALAQALADLDPPHAPDYAARREAFERTLEPLTARIAALRGRFAGQPVTATEPVAGYLAEALGLRMRNARFQLAVMNDTEPSARDIAAIETDLRTHAVRALLYNPQTAGGISRRLRGIAQAAGVPVVPTAETLPQGMTYPQWMLSQLEALERALSRP